MSYVTWLADVLRAAQCKVIEVPGWQERGHGPMGDIHGVMLHHTGPGSSEGLRNLILRGRSDLPGPLSHLFLDDDGTFYVMAAGHCNHAGPGEWMGVHTGGNSSFIGIEARNNGDGKDIWEAAQMGAYVTGVAAILNHIGASYMWAVGHKEWALPRGRKVDPSFNMDKFRSDVADTMHGTLLSSSPPDTVDPAASMLQLHDTGEGVKMLQILLRVNADGAFGPKTEAAVKSFQSAHGLTPDGLVGPKTWAALGVK
jgi:hypothetical protein